MTDYRGFILVVASLINSCRALSDYSTAAGYDQLLYEYANQQSSAQTADVVSGQPLPENPMQTAQRMIAPDYLYQQALLEQFQSLDPTGLFTDPSFADGKVYKQSIDAYDNHYSQQQSDLYEEKSTPIYEKSSYKKKKEKKVYVPIVIRKKKKKKKKTIATYKGFYIPGGTQVFGKFKKIKDCKKICEVTPNCFAADYNPWLKKCYLHTNITACEEMRTHPKLIHFKKVPCDLVETPRGLITLGAQMYGGLQQKGIKSLQDCIKKCATAGDGIAPDQIPVDIKKQICFGIDYDFATHKCYFHTNDNVCPPLIPVIPTPVTMVAAPSVIDIILCPFSEVTT